jgi:hypothetical protein
MPRILKPGLTLFPVIMTEKILEEGRKDEVTYYQRYLRCKLVALKKASLVMSRIVYKQ